MCVHDIKLCWIADALLNNRSVLCFRRLFCLHSPHQGYDSTMILTIHLRSELWFRDDVLLFIESGYDSTNDAMYAQQIMALIMIWFHLSWSHTSCYDLLMVLLVKTIITRIIMDDSLGHIPVTLDKYSCFNYVNN